MASILSKENISEIKQLKAQGKKIVLCHGVFDLVHPGHIIHFQEAKKMGDVLVVSVTAAKYVRKGPGRPYFDDEMRLKFLSAIECIDYVMLSEGYTVDDIVEAIEPDLYVKGEEYSKAEEDIVPSIQMPWEYYSSNVLGTYNVVECAKDAGIKKLVYSASSSCYGIPDKYPTDEQAEIRPQYPYALTKRLGEETVLHWGQVYGLPVITLRLFNVYGTRSRTSGTYGAVFGVFLAQKLAGQPFTVVGTGEQTRDFTYVTDVADAFYTAAMSDVVNQTFNVGSGGTYSVNRLCELLGGEIVHIPKRPGEPDCTFADTAKIERVLGWKAKVSLEEGVQKILDNIDYWKEAPVWTPDSISEATKDWFKYLS